MSRISVYWLYLAPIAAYCADRFTVLDDTQVYDTATNLVWEKTGGEKSVSFEEAEIYCEKLATASGLEWRLPYIKELATLVDENSYNPSIFPIFETQSRFYWSSTPNAADDGFVWLVNFSDSHIHSFRKQTQYFVRCTYSREIVAQ